MVVKVGECKVGHKVKCTPGEASGLQNVVFKTAITRSISLPFLSPSHVSPLHFDGRETPSKADSTPTLTFSPIQTAFARSVIHALSVQTLARNPLHAHLHRNWAHSLTHLCVSFKQNSRPQHSSGECIRTHRSTGPPIPTQHNQPHTHTPAMGGKSRGGRARGHNNRQPAPPVAERPEDYYEVRDRHNASLHLPTTFVCCPAKCANLQVIAAGTSVWVSRAGTG